MFIKWIIAFIYQFLSTPSARRATVAIGTAHGVYKDFYPRPPRGGRLIVVIHGGTSETFLSTPSARRATFRTEMCQTICFPFLSTPSARRATQIVFMTGFCYSISIHALREEGDKRP